MTNPTILRVLDKATNPNNLEKLLTNQVQTLQLVRITDVQVDQVSEISPDAGDLRQGNTQIRLDGIFVSKRLNIIDFYGGFVGNAITLPVNAFLEDNIVHLEFSGRYFQETGSGKTVTPKIYLGPAANEIAIGSNVSLAVTSSSVQRGFLYDVRITRAPNLGNYVMVVERFSIDSATGGSPQTIERTTITQITTATTLEDIDSLILYMGSTGTATTFQFYYDTLNIWIEEDLRDDDQLIWWSQPTGSQGYDTWMQSDNPTANFGTSIFLDVGESNATTGTVTRALIKFADLANLSAIIDQYDIVSATMLLRIRADLSNNARTMRVYRLLRDWNVLTATWNIFDTDNSWGTAGAGNSTTDYDGSAEVGSVSVGAGETLNTVKSISLDVDILRSMIVAGNYSFLLKMDTELNDLWQFHSADAATPSNAPIIYVVLQKR